jgi:hypothetical protein
MLKASTEIDDAEKEGPAKPESCFIHKADELAEMGVDMDPLTEGSYKFKRGRGNV